MSKKRDLEFLYEIGALRFIERSWRQFWGVSVANVCEHSFRVMWLALVLAKMEKAKNIEKILKMALVHDITESRTGDTNYVSRRYVKQNEGKALEYIFKDVNIEKDFIDIFREFNERKSFEAKIVKDADNLDVDLEIREMEAKGYKNWTKFRKVVYKDFYTKSARKIWREIQNSAPYNWHVNALNRFNEGDWKK